MVTIISVLPFVYPIYFHPYNVFLALKYTTTPLYGAVFEAKHIKFAFYAQNITKIPANNIAF